MPEDSDDPGAPQAISASATPSSLQRRDRGPIIAFASLKGGVGKTTMSLCAAELLRRWPPRPANPADPTALPITRPVVLIDADVAGTELRWVWNEGCGSEAGHPLYSTSEPLIDLLEEHAGSDEVLSRMIISARKLVEDEVTRGLVVPTFKPGTEMLPASLQWKQILELTGTYVTRTMARIIDALRSTGCAVVVDLPAFDVGFAHYAAEAVKHVDGKVFLVTDCDIRSLRSTQHHLLAGLATSDQRSTIWRNVVVNRAPDRSWREQFPSRLAEVAAWGSPSGSGAATPRLQAEFIRPVVAEGAPRIAQATGLRGSPRELFEAISTYINPSTQNFDDADRRRLRGDAE